MSTIPLCAPVCGPVPEIEYLYASNASETSKSHLNRSTFLHCTYRSLVSSTIFFVVVSVYFVGGQSMYSWLSLLCVFQTSCAYALVQLATRFTLTPDKSWAVRLSNPGSVSRSARYGLTKAGAARLHASQGSHATTHSERLHCRKCCVVPALHLRLDWDRFQE